MLSSVSNSSLARVSQARALATRAIAPTSIAFIRGCHYHQARHFWSSLWPSLLDSESSADKPHRYRFKTRYKYTRALRRQLSWDKSLKAQHESFVKTRMHNVDPMDRWHFYRRVMDPMERRETTNPLFGADADYVIDPITNRKVPRHPSNIAGPAPEEDVNLWENRRKRLESLYQDLERVNLDAAEEPRAFHSDGPPPADELEKYRNVDIDVPSHNEELIHRVNDLPRESPQGVPAEPPQPASEAPEPPAEIKDELEQYKKVDINYPPSMNEELIHRVQDLPEKPESQETPVAESSEKVSAFSVDGKPQYEDLDEYKPYMPSAEALDPSSEDVQARSWPSRVRHLEQRTGADTANKMVENKTKASTASNGILNSQQTSTWNAPSSRRLQTRAAPETETAMFDSDPYSKEPTGLETSWAQECVQDPKANKMYIRHYAADGTASEPVVVAPSGEDPTPKEANPAQHATPEPSSSKADTAPVSVSQESAEPILYKILAYDPTTQTVTSAETTSVVQDLSKPLSPAEVMIRLSNPTKFFPHFQALQDEGFEIASGSGDVLVFRKARKVAETNMSASAKVNPVDMMGRSTVPDIGDYMNPTGFVSDGYPVEVEESYAPGRQNASQSQAGAEETAKPRRPGLMRRTATGAAWLAGTAYGVGVVSEFVNKGREGAKKK